MTMDDMTYERMNRCMGNIMRQFDRGLLSKKCFADEMWWILERRRRTLEAR